MSKKNIQSQFSRVLHGVFKLLVLSENLKDNPRDKMSTAAGRAEGNKIFNKTDSHADLLDFCLKACCVFLDEMS